jgi:hypothetical protein
MIDPSGAIATSLGSVRGGPLAKVETAPVRGLMILIAPSRFAARILPDLVQVIPKASTPPATGVAAPPAGPIRKISPLPPASTLT